MGLSGSSGGSLQLRIILEYATANIKCPLSVKYLHDPGEVKCHRGRFGTWHPRAFQRQPCKALQRIREERNGSAIGISLCLAKNTYFSEVANDAPQKVFQDGWKEGTSIRRGPFPGCGVHRFRRWGAMSRAEHISPAGSGSRYYYMSLALPIHQAW